MQIPRRLWDSSVIIGYLTGQVDIKTDCDQIIEQAERGELEIVVSTIAQGDVAYIPGKSVVESESLIQEFFSRRYIVTAAVDIPLVRIVRRLIREHGAGLAAFDAIHVATAIQHKVPIIETTDPHLLRLDGKEGNPKIIIRRPKYQGPVKLNLFGSGAT